MFKYVYGFEERLPVDGSSLLLAVRISSATPEKILSAIILLSC